MNTTPRAMAGVTLTLVFLAGIAVGMAADRLRGPKPMITKVFAEDLSGVLDKLGLTPAQRAAADSIVRRRAPRADAMMLDVAAQLRGISDSLSAELRSILTPDQRARLDTLRGKRKLLLQRKTVRPDGRTVVDTVFSKP